MKKLLIPFFIFHFSLFISTSVDAQQWWPVGKGILGSASSCELVTIDDSLYVMNTGAFLNDNDTIYSHIASWNGAKWDSLGKGEYELDDLIAYPYHDFVIIAGALDRINGGFLDGEKVRKIAGWDGQIWFPFTNGFDSTAAGSVNKLIEFQGCLFAAGRFIYSGNTYVTNIAQLNLADSSWLPVGNGISGSWYEISDMAVYNDELYIGGGFLQANPVYPVYPAVQSPNLIRWNGTYYRPVENGVPYFVEEMEVDSVHNLLYFNSDGWLGCWDGEKITWNDSIYSDGGFHGLLYYHNELYAGSLSSFYRVANGNIVDTLSSIVKWTGKEWVAVGAGLTHDQMQGANYGVSALEVFKDTLYACGRIIEAGGLPARSFVKYYEPPDSNCTFLQTTIISPADTINPLQNPEIKFGCNIFTADNWYWDFGNGNTGTGKSPWTTYTQPGTYTVMLIVNYQYCTDTAYYTIVADTVFGTAAPPTGGLPASCFLGQNIPNPFEETTTIPYSIPQGSKGKLIVQTAKGKTVLTKPLQAGENTITLSLETLKSGVYLYTLEVDGKVVDTKKMIVQ
jgi:hypothetical protein